MLFTIRRENNSFCNNNSNTFIFLFVGDLISFIDRPPLHLIYSSWGYTHLPPDPTNPLLNKKAKVLNNISKCNNFDIAMQVRKSQLHLERH
jgi:hypothetical protein